MLVKVTGTCESQSTGLLTGSGLRLSELCSVGDCIFRSILEKKRLLLRSGLCAQGLQAWGQRLRNCWEDSPVLAQTSWEPCLPKGHTCPELCRVESSLWNVTVDPYKGSFRVPTTEEKTVFKNLNYKQSVGQDNFSIIILLGITSTYKVSPQNLVREENSEPCNRALHHNCNRDIASLTKQRICWQKDSNTEEMYSSRLRAIAHKSSLPT